MARVPDAKAMSLDDGLTRATNHVTIGRRAVARQRQLIEKLTGLGCSTLDAEHNLGVFLSTLQILEEHLHILQRKRAREIVSVVP